MLPQEPSLVSASLPGSGGRIGSDPQDFVVDEIPLYAASGQGEHRYVRIEKTGWNTTAVVRVIARAAGVDARDVGYAGMKDRHAVTTQWFSLPARSQPPESWQLPDGVRVIEATFHNNKLRTGHLLANRFVVRIVGVERIDAIEPIAKAIAERGVLNAFGAQRFGHGGRNLDDALQWLEKNGRARDRFAAKLMPTVLQSEFFNRYADARIAAGEDRLIDGEWVRITQSGKYFRVDDVAVEQPRRDAGTLILTGPLPGGRMGENLRDAAALDAAVWASMGIATDKLGPLWREAPGTRRDLRLLPDDFGHAIDGSSVVFRFTLPAGSFATQVIREFTRTPWLEDRGSSGTEEEGE